MRTPATPIIVLLGLTSLLIVTTPSDARRTPRELRAVEAEGGRPGATPGRFATTVAGEQVLGEWDFEDGVGGPDAQGFEGNNQTIATETILADSLAGVTRLRFRFRSDNGYSDEDGLFNSSGAFVLDNLRVRDDTGVVNLQLFELEGVGAQTTVDGTWSTTTAPAYGDHAGLFDGAMVLQEDPLVTNTTHLWGFFNGSTYDFTCGGHPEQLVVPYQKTINHTELYIDNEIRSPAISLTEDINGDPVTLTTFKLAFDVYRDLPLSPLVFYVYHVRSFVAGCWGPWKNDGFVYYGDRDAWLRQTFDVTSDVAPGATHVQVSIGVVDACFIWCGTIGTGLCHSHSPLIDNVAVLATHPTLEVTNTFGAGPGSLRQAIIDANQDPNTNLIVFNIPGAGLQTINLSTVLPQINSPVIIDGTTQPGYAGTPLVRIQGTSLPMGSSLLSLLGGDSEVRGLSLYEVSQAGVLLQSDNNVVEGCAFELCSLGVDVSGNGNRIGGVLAGQGNLFANNLIAVLVSSGIGNAIRGNQMTIASSNDMAIDLYPFAVTPNDPLDMDSGANMLQNFPTITHVDGAQGEVTGSLDSRANGTFTIDFYTGSCGTNGRSAGELHLGSMDVTTNGSGHVDFVASLAPFPVAAPITATATDASGNTSEFARCYTPLLVTNVANSGAGSLRQAITDANLSADPSTILFQIPGDVVHTISPASPLPVVTRRATIDGYSQPGSTPNTMELWNGSNAEVRIVLDGSLLGVGSGLVLTADTCLVRGLAIGNFADDGIRIWSANLNRIEGCFLGTDASGHLSAPNDHGVWVSTGAGNTIGGASPAARCVLSGNREEGVLITLGGANTIRNCLIGVGASGMTAVGNGTSGIRVHDSPSSTIDDNVVSANGAMGINVINGNIQNSRIRNNRVGTGVSGASALGNAFHGVQIGTTLASGAPIVVGGSAGQGNLIAFNGSNGIRAVLLAGGMHASITDNTIHSNSTGVVVFSGLAQLSRNAIGPNAGLGIDLGANGPTPNDQFDIDAGANGLQNYPMLNSVVKNGSVLMVSGSLSSSPGLPYVIELFASSACDPSGNGEGTVYLSEFPVVTSGFGIATFNVPVSGDLPGGYVITATARTASNFGTSEFSPCIVYTNTPIGSNVAVTPVDGATGGTPVDLTFDNITTAGNTSLTITDTGPPPPGSYTFGDDPTFYDLTTTATYTGSIEVCLAYDEGAISGSEADLALLHYDDTLIPPDWVDITASVDTVANVLCGTTTSLSPFAIAEPAQPTAIGDTPATPTEFALHPCAPNPFNPITTIRYDIPTSGAHVEISVYDVTGRRVRTLVDRAQSGGRQLVTWDGRDDRGQGVASGVYFYRMSAGSFVQTRKMVLLK